MGAVNDSTRDFGASSRKLRSQSLSSRGNKSVMTYPFLQVSRVLMCITRHT